MGDLKFKYVRIQGKELARNTMTGKGIFSMCWDLIRNDTMDEEDASLFREIDSWFCENLPWPEPCMRQEPVICWFKAENTEEMMRIDPDEGIVSLQLFGSDPEIMAQMAAKIEDRPFAILDINMGSPVPKVVNNGEGSALM